MTGIHGIIFGDLDHRLSLIDRWATAQTIHKQSVSEHIFNVERMAIRIATQWFGVTDPAALFVVMWFAHRHEDFEALSGDLPTMVKPYFDEVAFEKDHSDVMTPVVDGGQWVRNIVKLADMLDAFWFLCIENRLGNQYLDNHYEHEPRRIFDYFDKTWPNNEHVRQHLVGLIEEMRTCGSIRHSRRGR